MSDQDIINLGKAIADYGVAHQTKMDELNTARQQVVNTDATLKSTSKSTVFFIAHTSGDDANDGKTSATPVKTFARLCVLLERDTYNTINIMEDLEVDYRHDVNSGVVLDFRGRAADGVADQERTISIVDASNSPTRPGGLNFRAAVLLVFRDIHLEISTSSTFSFVESRVVTRLYFETCRFSKTAGSDDCSVLWSYFNSLVMSNFTNSPIAGLEGQIMRGVGSGVNPNSIGSGNFFYQSNLASA